MGRGIEEDRQIDVVGVVVAHGIVDKLIFDIRIHLMAMVVHCDVADVMLRGQFDHRRPIGRLCKAEIVVCKVRCTQEA